MSATCSSTGSRPSRRETASRHRPCHPSAFRGGDVFLDFPTGRRTLLWRSTARSSVTEQWACTSNTSVAPPRRVPRPDQAGVLPQARLRGRLDGRVHRHARRLHGLVPGQEDQDGVRHEHHGSSRRARSCGIIGGDGINASPTKRHQPLLRKNSVEIA